MAAGKRKPRQPSGLKAAGKQLWSSVLEGLTLRPDEISIVAAAAKTADQVAALERHVAKSGIMIAGSMGQKVLNPTIPELRQQRQLLASLLARLDIPEAEEGAPGEWDNLDASQRARKAARARWSRKAS